MRRHGAILGLALLAAAGTAAAQDPIETVGSDDELYVQNPVHPARWHVPVPLRVRQGERPDKPPAKTASVDVDPYPYDGVWEPVAADVPIPASGEGEVPVVPERNAHYRVRDDQGREVVVLMAVDLRKTLTFRRKRVRGLPWPSMRGVDRYTVAMYVRGPDEAMRRRRLVVGIKRRHYGNVRHRRVRFRRLAATRWRARTRFRIRAEGGFSACIAEPRDDPFDLPPERPGRDCEHELRVRPG